jgi:hypothetical protein
MAKDGDETDDHGGQPIVKGCLYLRLHHGVSWPFLQSLPLSIRAVKALYHNRNSNADQMPRGERRPADTNAAAVVVGKIVATDEIEDARPTRVAA